MKQLIEDIEAFCRSSGIAPSTLGLRAVGDGKFFARLKGGGRCWPETEDKVRRFIAAKTAPENEGAA